MKKPPFTKGAARSAGGFQTMTIAEKDFSNSITSCPGGGRLVCFDLVDIVESGDIITDDLLHVRFRNAPERLRDQILGVRPGGVSVRIV
jgi:hypothetical protein